jgi:hypothetical protein
MSFSIIVVSYAEGFLVVFDMRQCKITLKTSPALYQEEEERTKIERIWHNFLIVIIYLHL